MTTDSKTRGRRTREAGGEAHRKATAVPCATVDRTEALRVGRALSEADRDVVAAIIDWQLDGLDEGAPAVR